MIRILGWGQWHRIDVPRNHKYLECMPNYWFKKYIKNFISMTLLQTMHNACGVILLVLWILCSHADAGRERVSLNGGWRFSRFLSSPDSLSYTTLKPWILPSGNDFISGTKYQRPSGTAPGSNVQYVQASFDDSAWEPVNVPHDWGIKGPFNSAGSGGGGMGRLPVGGVGWYRRNFKAAAAGKSVFLDIDGAMSYAAVWLNGNLVGGWPYGYNSFRLDLTPYVTVGDNLLAIRLDNAADNSRWYPGAGLYRNIWLVTVDSTHVAQYGTYITTPSVSAQSATLNLAVNVENKATTSRDIEVKTEVFVLNAASGQAEGAAVASFPQAKVTVASGAKAATNSSTTVTNPQLWGPPPSQKPNLYIARTSVYASGNNTAIDTYETTFGIRSLTYDASKGLLVNGQHVRIQGTCNHHDQGALGSAFHFRAAERQLQMLQDMGSNGLRTSHNPPAPELLQLADQMGFMVLDEIFDCWDTAKTTNDFHLIFPDVRKFLEQFSSFSYNSCFPAPHFERLTSPG